MSEPIPAGSTDQTIDVFLQDSSSSTGAGLTGLLYNTSGLTCYYRKGATGTSTQLSLATQTVGGAHSDGGFVEIDSTNQPGMYRLDLSDTIVASEGYVTIYLQGAANLLPTPIRVDVVSATRGLAGTALPAAAADAAGGLVISDAGGLDIDNRLVSATATAALEDQYDGTGLTGDTYPATQAEIAALNDPSAAEIRSEIDSNSTQLAAIVEDTGTTLPALIGTPADTDIATDIANVQTGVTSLLGRITATLFSGITSLAEWLGLMAGKQTPDATALTEVQATGAGSGTYDATTDSLQAVRDNQSGGGGGLTQDDIDSIVAGVTAVGDQVQQANDNIILTYRGAVWSQQLTGLSVLTGQTDIVFCLKRDAEDTDANAVLKVSASTGLEVLKGSTSVTAGDASIVVDQETPTGEITLTVADSVMAQVFDGTYVDAWKMLNPSGDTYVRVGKTIVRPGGVDETT